MLCAPAPNLSARSAARERAETTPTEQSVFPQRRRFERSPHVPHPRGRDAVDGSANHGHDCVGGAGVLDSDSEPLLPTSKLVAFPTPRRSISRAAGGSSERGQRSDSRVRSPTPRSPSEPAVLPAPSASSLRHEQLRQHRWGSAASDAAKAAASEATLVANLTEHSWCCRFGEPVCTAAALSGVLSVRRVRRPSSSGGGPSPHDGARPVFRRIVFMDEVRGKVAFACNISDIDLVEVSGDRGDAHGEAPVAAEQLTPTSHFHAPALGPQLLVISSGFGCHRGRSSSSSKRGASLVSRAGGDAESTAAASSPSQTRARSSVGGRTCQAVFSGFDDAEAVAQTLAALVIIERNAARSAAFARVLRAVRELDAESLDEPTPTPAAAVTPRAARQTLRSDSGMQDNAGTGESALAAATADQRISSLRVTCSWVRTAVGKGNGGGGGLHEGAALGTAVAMSDCLLHRVPAANTLVISRRSLSWGASATSLPSRAPCCWDAQFSATAKRLACSTGPVAPGPDNTDEEAAGEGGRAARGTAIAHFVDPEWERATYASAQHCDLHIHIPLALFPASPGAFRTPVELLLATTAFAADAHLLSSVDGDAVVDSANEEEGEDLLDWWDVAHPAASLSATPPPPASAASPWRSKRSSSSGGGGGEAPAGGDRGLATINLLRLPLPSCWFDLRDCLAGGLSLRIRCHCGGWSALLIQKVLVVVP